MKCLDMAAMEALAAGHMKPAQAEVIRAHLQQCKACQALASEYEANEDALARIRRARHSRPLSQEDRERLSSTETKVISFLQKQ
jgi:anti-sigma factor RsiW